MKNPRCIGCLNFLVLLRLTALAQLHSMAVDFPKTGESNELPDILANLSGAIIPKRLRPRRWPEYFILAYLDHRLTFLCNSFMEKEGSKETCTASLVRHQADEQ